MVFKKGVPSKNIALQEHFKYPKDFDHRPPRVVEKSESADTNCCCQNIPSKNIFGEPGFATKF